MPDSPIPPFDVQAARYRGRKRRFLISSATAVGLVALALFVPDTLSKWVGIPGMVLMVVALFAFLLGPTLRCPDCRQSAEKLDRFCPVCGADGLRRNALMGTRCDACRRGLGSYKSRNYSIHFCTHCGTLLTQRGV